MIKILTLSLIFLFVSCSKESQFKGPVPSEQEENIGSISEPPGDSDSDVDAILGKNRIVIANRADENIAKPKKDSAGYEQLGVWQQSRIAGFRDSISRYSDDPLAQVIYSTDKVKQSRYCVSVYRMTHGNSIDKALYEVMDQDSVLSQKVLDHRADESLKGWYHLGEYSFSSGVAKVKLSRDASAGAGYLRADDVRFRRLKEGHDCLGRVFRTVKKHAIIDNRKDINNSSSKKDTVGYRQKGEWSQSVLSGFKDLISRYSYERDASAHYYAKVMQSDYCLRFFRVTHPNSSKAISIVLKVNGVTRDDKEFDYSLSTSEKGWVVLGEYTFAPEDEVEVVIKKTATDDDDVLRADALQFTTKLSRCQ